MSSKMIARKLYEGFNSQRVYALNFGTKIELYAPVTIF